MSGTFERGLVIVMVTPRDSGAYTCQYDDGAKAAAVFTADVNVTGVLPVGRFAAGLLAMSIVLSAGFLGRRSLAKALPRKG